MSLPGTLTFETIANRLSGGAPVELDADRCLTNNIIFADEYNPHHVRPWVIGNQFGALCLVWAGNEQDAFDAAWNADKLGGLAVDEDDYRERCEEACADAECHDPQCPWKEDKSACQCDHECNTPDGVMLLGNASEPADSTYAWIAEVTLTPIQERYFAEARGANADTLGGI